ncbi:MAG: DUF3426 domain-containing protein, partial [Gammaproteobacteria bacterium]|nr:DUF3426 domain-containing protein [Gammaproteobacteria bacterium]
FDEDDFDDEPTRPVIDTNMNSHKSNREDSGDMEILNSLMENSDSETYPDIDLNLDEELGTTESEEDAKLFEDFNKITQEEPDFNNSLDDVDDLDDLDDGEDLLAQLDQIEDDFRNNKMSEEEEESSSSEDVGSFMVDDKDKVKEEVVPSFLTQADASETRPSAIFGWLSGTMALLLLLITQYLHFNSTELSQSRQIRSFVKPVCAITGCSIPLIKRPKKIVTITHDVRSYAPINNTLEMQLMFKNKATYTQSYPILEVTFLTTSGDVVARRKFLPTEYADNSMNLTQGLESNQSQEINLKIVDPDPSALLSFQFNYL